jgi:hypothetical protein
LERVVGFGTVKSLKRVNFWDLKIEGNFLVLWKIGGKLGYGNLRKILKR